MDKYTTEEVTKELIQSSKLPEPLHLAAMLEQTLQSPLHGKAADCLRRMYAQAQAAQPAPEQYAALEQALTRLQKRYGELEARLAANPTTEESLTVQPAPVQEQATDGWKWMTNPTWNNGYPIPVQIFTTEDGEVFYRPFDFEATVFEWSERSDDWREVTPPAAPDLQAELDATNKQVEILSDALAESRREVAALPAVQEPVALN